MSTGLITDQLNSRVVRGLGPPAGALFDRLSSKKGPSRLH